MTDPRTPSHDDNKPGVPSDGGNKGTQKPADGTPGVGGDGGNRDNR